MDIIAVYGMSSGHSPPLLSSHLDVNLSNLPVDNWAVATAQLTVYANQWLDVNGGS